MRIAPFFVLGCATQWDLIIAADQMKPTMGFPVKMQFHIVIFDYAKCTVPFVYPSSTKASFLFKEQIVRLGQTSVILTEHTPI